ncbi:MAG: hypothetical protein ISR72_10960 [Methylobacter sp.]|nr:hypothetical protein [Methylobacter sp.]
MLRLRVKPTEPCCSVSQRVKVGDKDFQVIFSVRLIDTPPGHSFGFLAADFMPVAALLSTKINSLSLPQP